MRIRFSTAGFVIGVLLALLLFQSSAKADSLSWSWALSGNGFNGSGTLTSDSTPTYYIFGYGLLVNSMDGQLNGSSLTLNTTYSSLLFPGGPNAAYCGTGGCMSLSEVAPAYNAGLHFSTNDGVTWNVFLNEWGSTPLPFILVNYSNSAGANVNVTMVPTPEPSTLLLISVGLIGLVGLTLLNNRLS
jgi:hypothetical protein